MIDLSGQRLQVTASVEPVFSIRSSTEVSEVFADWLERSSPSSADEAETLSPPLTVP
jgi:hypothetical protein